MAKISSFPKDTQIDGTEIVPVVSDGANKHVTSKQLSDYIVGNVPPVVVDKEGIKSEIMEEVNRLLGEMKSTELALLSRMSAVEGKAGRNGTDIDNLINRFDELEPDLNGISETPYYTALDRISALENKAIIIEQ